MDEFRADLHCHTTFSDGFLTPEEIVHLAKQKNLSGLSITDHDSVAAYAIAEPLCKRLGITLISGVEFSSFWKNMSVHILAYGFAFDDPHIDSFCKMHAERRRERNQAILKLLAKHQMPLSYEDVIASIPNPLENNKRNIGRPHIALAMINKGYVRNVKEAFKLYLGENRPCYAQGKVFDAAETIDLIHRASGIAVIAHPHLITNSTLMQELLKMNFDGIECYYGTNSQKNNERWIKIAHEKKWLITGGSDFHGASKPEIDLGCSWIDETAFKAIQSLIFKHPSNE